MIEFMPAKIFKAMKSKSSKPIKGKALLKYTERYCEEEHWKVSLTIMRVPLTRACFVCGDPTNFADLYLFKAVCCEQCDRKLWMMFFEWWERKIDSKFSNTVNS